jgi:molybdate transport system substrate-binding protein
MSRVLRRFFRLVRRCPRCLCILGYLAIPAVALAPVTACVRSSTGPAPAQATEAGSAAAARLQGQVTVFAAASLTDVFTEIGTALERANPGTKIVFNFAGSPALRTQLEQGARADVFASADEPTMDAVDRQGLLAGPPRLFALNRLVVIVPAQNPGAIERLQDLARPGLKLVLARSDVPVGAYARQALARMSQDPAFGTTFAERVLANVVSEEPNVRQVVTKVQLGEADAGIVYATDASAGVREAVRSIPLPDQFNVIARYPIAVVKNAPNEPGARAFVDYVLSPAGQAILAKHGFLPPTSAASGTIP